MGASKRKDIDDAFFLACVDWLSMQPSPPVPWVRDAAPSYAVEHFPHWVFTWNLDCMMPMFPTEVIVAKASALIRRGLLTGCDCGCRGDFELTAKGVKLLIDAGQPIHQSGWLVTMTVGFKAG